MTGKKPKRTSGTGDPFRDLEEVVKANPARPQKLAVSIEGMVATQHYLATQAGVEILEAGGNAIDAAVAAALALGVAEPQASGLGGQTMVLVHLAGKRRTFALDGSSRAPNRATREALRGSQRLRGFRATTVPSTPMVLEYMRTHYGSLGLGTLIEPAVRIATEGFEVSELQHALMKRESRHLRRFSGGEVFLRPGHRVWGVGALLRQPALAKTLQRLAEHGVEDFYRGEIAQKIVASMAANNGLIHDDDLARLPTPIERRPISVRSRGLRVLTFPPPGAGRALAQMLGLVRELPADLDPESPEGAVLLALVMHRAAQDRADRPFAPALYPQTKKRRTLDPERTRELAQGFLRRVREGGETTHLSVMDREGNAVALTQSIERVFGSMAMTPSLGFLYNNYMSAFEYKDISHPYYLRPNGVPWGSVAPSIGFRGSKPWVAIGSPGSDRIVTAVLQVLMRLEGHKPFEAVAAPRMHCTLDGKLALEASRFRDDIPPLLEQHGFTIDRRDPFSFYMGCVQLVLNTKEGFVGVADPRRDGSAGGPKR